MRPIKFRGRDLDSGEYVYGFYVTGAGNKPFILVTNAQGQYLREINPDSVAQLVGYDANGKEVYEGDKVVYAFEEWTAKLGSYVRNTGGLCHYNFKNVTLKEADQ